jgi:AcrR family transcriptional regulator
MPPAPPLIRADGAVAAEAGPEAEDLTHRLLRAAIDEFADKGLDKAGVAAIARRAGVTTGAIYSRWSGKQEMMLDAVDVMMSHHLARLITSQVDPSAPEILAALGADLVGPGDEAGEAILMEAFAAARRDRGFAEMLQRRLRDQEGHLALVIAEGKVAGVIDPALSTDAVVALCHAISLGFTMFRAVDRPLPDPADWNTLIQRLIAAALPVSESPHNTE